MVSMKGCLNNLVLSVVLFAGSSPAERISGRSENRQVPLELELRNPAQPELPSQSYPVQLCLDAHGFPVEYQLPLFTDVCLDRVCKPIDATLVWDAIGNFQRLEISRQFPLTKGDHDPFSPEDYERLNQILKNRESILGKYPLDFFVKPPVKSDADSVDGVSSATPKAVQDAVVSGAAYTSWVLWRWMNGEAAEKLLARTESHCTEDYLEHALAMEDPRFHEFALRFLLVNQRYSPEFTAAAFQLLEEGGNGRLALQYLTAAPTGQEELNLRLITLIGANPDVSRRVLDYLESLPELDLAFCERLAEQLEQVSEYYDVHRVLSLLEKHAGESETIRLQVEPLLDRENRFIVRRAREFMDR
jgi:hypothetical protein